MNEESPSIVDRIMSLVTGVVFAAMWFGVLWILAFYVLEEIGGGPSRDPLLSASTLTITVLLVFVLSMFRAFWSNLHRGGQQELMAGNESMWRADTGANRNQFEGIFLILPLLSAGAILSAFGSGPKRD